MATFFVFLSFESIGSAFLVAIYITYYNLTWDWRDNIDEGRVECLVCKELVYISVEIICSFSDLFVFRWGKIRSVNIDQKRVIKEMVNGTQNHFIVRCLIFWSKIISFICCSYPHESMNSIHFIDILGNPFRGTDLQSLYVSINPSCFRTLLIKLPSDCLIHTTLSSSCWPIFTTSSQAICWILLLWRTRSVWSSLYL